MTLLILSLPVAVLSLLFTLYNLNRRQRAILATDVVTPATASTGKNRSVVGIAQPGEPAEVSPVTDQPALWLRAFRTSKGFFMSRSNNGSNVRRIGKVSTNFRLVDEDNPDASIIIRSGKISETDILVRNRRYSLDGAPMDTVETGGDPLKTAGSLLLFHVIKTEGMEEKTIQPGDRIWAHGRIREGEDGLSLSGWGSWLDDRPPAQRAAWHTAFAKAGAITFGISATIALVAWLMQ